MELLKKLFAIHSPSGDEKRIRKFVKKWVRANVPDAIIKGDMYGNLYITKGEAEHYPCIAAHLDQVQKPYPADYEVLEANGVIFGWSQSERSRKGLGGDDKCGIWIALNCLREVPEIKVALFSCEERGCVGSSRCDMSFFDDTRFVAEADRRGHSDFITEIGWSPLCSTEFVELSGAESFGYYEESGMMTDVEQLRENGYPNCCCNFSCGYYEPHTDNEFVVWDDLINAFALAMNMCEKITEPMPYLPLDYYGGPGGFEADNLMEMLDYGYYDESMSTDAIWLDVKDCTTLDKSTAVTIINEWKSDRRLARKSGKWSDYYDKGMYEF